MTFTVNGEKKSNIDFVKCHVRFRLLVRLQLTCRDRNLPDKSTNYCKTQDLVSKNIITLRGLKHFIHFAIKNSQLVNMFTCTAK